MGTLPTVTAPTGYTFDGWFTAATGGTAVNQNTTFNENKTVYAQYSAIQAGEHVVTALSVGSTTVSLVKNAGAFAEGKTEYWLGDGNTVELAAGDVIKILNGSEEISFLRGQGDDTVPALEADTGGNLANPAKTLKVATGKGGTYKVYVKYENNNWLIDVDEQTTTPPTPSGTATMYIGNTAADDCEFKKDTYGIDTWDRDDGYYLDGTVDLTADDVLSFSIGASSTKVPLEVEKNSTDGALMGTKGSTSLTVAKTATYKITLMKYSDNDNWLILIQEQSPLKYEAVADTNGYLVGKISEKSATASFENGYKMTTATNQWNLEGVRLVAGDYVTVRLGTADTTGHSTIQSGVNTAAFTMFTDNGKTYIKILKSGYFSFYYKTADNDDHPNEIWINSTPDTVTGAAVTLTLNANGGSGSAASATTGADGKLATLPAAPTTAPTGKGFLGWYTAENLGEKVTTNTVFGAETTLYARWGTLSDYYVVGKINGTENWTNAVQMISVTPTIGGQSQYEAEVTFISGDKFKIKNGGTWISKIHPASEVKDYDNNETNDIEIGDEQLPVGTYRIVLVDYSTNGSDCCIFIYNA